MIINGNNNNNEVISAVHKINNNKSSLQEMQALCSGGGALVGPFANYQGPSPTPKWDSLRRRLNGRGLSRFRICELRKPAKMQFKFSLP